MTVEDARAQSTTHDNLDQWFDNVKFDLLATEMVVDEIELDENGDLVSEVKFKPDVKSRIINIDETHHDLSIAGNKVGLAPTPTTIPCCNKVQTGVSNQHATSPVPVQQQQLERRFLHSTFLTQVPSQKRT